MEKLQKKNDVSGGSDPAAQRHRLFSIIAFAAVAALLVGGFSILNGITSPFPKLANSSDQEDTSAALATLKKQDTDNDGLSDYDEIFTYFTSVFVRDSDSDGISDKDEVTAHTDPNCPAGKSCGIIAANTNTAPGSQAIVLRESLRKAGVPSSVLQSSDDATLLKSYQDILGGNGNVNSDATSSGLSSLGASQVRDLLKSTGLDAATLNGVDDATLLQIFRDAIGTG